jgi:hypothetical protein
MKLAERGNHPGYDSSTQISSAVDTSLPEFLTRSPDPNWIDIEMMGYWLQKCGREHGDKCRRPFGLDMLKLGQANLLIDVERKCLTLAKPEYRYACLSYVCKLVGRSDDWCKCRDLCLSLEVLDCLLILPFEQARSAGLCLLRGWRQDTENTKRQR